MCKNASATASGLMQAIRPTLVNLLTFLKLIGTAEAQSALTAFDSALTAVKNWQHGTAAQMAIEAVNDFTAIFNVLPIPINFKVLENVISAGIVAVLGMLEGNSPAPATTEEHALDEHDVQAHHQVAATAKATAQVAALVPSFQPRVFTRAPKQYTDTWNQQVVEGNFDPSLQVA